MYKIIVLKYKLLDVLIYSTVEYIEYMYKIIALRSDFCDLDVVIFQNTEWLCRTLWSEPLQGIVYGLWVM